MAIIRILVGSGRRQSRHPVHSGFVVTIASVGIGAVVLAYAILENLILHPTALPEPERVVLALALRSQGETRFGPSLADYLDWRAQSRSFEAFGAALFRPVTLRTHNGAVRVNTAYVSGDYFHVLGARPLLGRVFNSHEGATSDGRIAVLSYEFWSAVLGSDDSILGRELDTSEGRLTVVGILPRGTRFPNWADVITPLEPLIHADTTLLRRDARTALYTLGRLAPGVTPAQAYTDLHLAAVRLAQLYPQTNSGWDVSIEPLEEAVVGPRAKPTWLLFVGSLLVLLAVLANVAILSLLRASARQPDFAVQRAVGARVSQLLAAVAVDALLVSAMALGGALLLARSGLSLASFELSTVLPRLASARLGPGAVGIAVGATMALFAVIAGMWALVAIRSDVRYATRPPTTRVVSPKATRLRTGLVVAEVGLSYLLIAGSAAIGAKYYRDLAGGTGLSVDHLLSLHIEPPRERYASIESRAQLFAALARAFSATPGVVAVGIINHAPLTRNGVLTQVIQPGIEEDSTPRTVYRVVDPDYFRTVGQRVVAGRSLTESDRSSDIVAVVANETFAKSYGGSAKVVGQRLGLFRQAPGSTDFGKRFDAEVVGVVSDVRDWGLSRPTLPALYIPFSFDPWPTAFLAVRTRGAATAFINSARRTIASIDPALDVPEVEAVAGQLSGLLSSRRMAVELTTGLAIVTAVLAFAGLFGVVAVSIEERRAELGVRLALGASASQLIRALVARSLVLAVLGAGAGFAVVVISQRAIRDLPEMDANSGWTLWTATCSVVLILATVASWIPARRAARLHPSDALRSG